MLQTLPNTKSQLVVVINAVLEVYNLHAVVMGNYVHLPDYSYQKTPFIIGNPRDDLLCGLRAFAFHILSEGNQESSNTVLSVSDCELEKKTAELQEI